ncbi:MAG: DAK2 domain-containing protein [Actinomycetota bacterium]
MAYEALLEPVEGTILTVMRSAADAVQREHVDSLPHLFEVAASAARVAVEQTWDKLQALTEAGVLDAGGLGLWVILDAFAAELSARNPAADLPTSPRAAGKPKTHGEPPSSVALEVQYVIEAPAESIETLRRELTIIGSSIAISGGESEGTGTWNVHVHTDDAEAVIAAGRAYGLVHATSINVVAFADQMQSGSHQAANARQATVSIVAVASGEGFVSLYRDLGVDVIVDGGASMEPSPERIAVGIEQAEHADVIVLPNGDASFRAAAHACELVVDRRAVVIETRDLAHGITTMLAYGDARDLEANAAQMRQAASVAATARVIVASHDSVTEHGVVRAGQALGLGGSLIVVDDDPIECVVSLVLALDAEEPVEVVTVFAGQSAPAQERDAILHELKEQLLGVDVEMRDGGQPIERYLIAVE